jgi:hypothetical protein
LWYKNIFFIVIFLENTMKWKILETLYWKEGSLPQTMAVNPGVSVRLFVRLGVAAEV